MIVQLFLICLILTSCASIHEYRPYTISFRENLSQGRCEEAQAQIPLEKDDTKFLRLYQGSVGYVAYVATMPVTIGLDFLLMGRCQYGCPAQEPSIEFFFPTSARTYEYTKEMRCPDTGYYSQKLLEISECYEQRGDMESIREAYMPLKYVEDRHAEFGVSCLQIRDYKVIKASRERLEKKLQMATKANSWQQGFKFGHAIPLDPI